MTAVNSKALPLTAAKLIQGLQQRGCKVTPRGLRDWRRRGLLPQLIPHGRGRGRGKQYLVDDPEAVIEQALFVDWLLSRHSRTETALLGLWFAGFRVDVDLARHTWLASIRKSEAQIRRLAEQAGGIGEALGRLAASGGRKVAAAQSLDYSIMRDISQEICELLYDQIINLI